MSLLPGTAAARYGSENRLTAMNAAHDAFVRDLGRLARAAHDAAVADPIRHREVARGWILFKGMLEIHHHAEDDFIWPRLRLRLRTSEAAMSVLDEMEAEHDLIDPFVRRIDQALARTPELGADIPAGPIIEEFADALGRHMAHEEKEAMPMVAEALSDREWAGVVSDIHGFVTRRSVLSVSDFVPWLTDGQHPADETAILAGVIPGPVRPMYQWLWKPRYRRTQRW